MTSSSHDISPPSERTHAQRTVSRTVGYYAAIFALGLSASVFGPTLPSLAQRTHTDLSGVSFLFIARSIAYLFGSMQSGRWYDRLPGHLVLAAGLLLMIVAMLLTPVISVLWVLTLAVLILGAADSMVDLGGNTLLLWLHGARAGPFMNGLHFFFGFGSLLAPFVVAQVIARNADIAWAYWALAALMLPGVVWLLRLPSPPAPVSSGDGSVPRENRMLLFLIALFIALYVGAEIAFGSWIYSYALTLKLSDASGAAYLTSAFWAALALGRIVAIPIASRLKPSTIVPIDLAGCLLSVGLMILQPHSLVAIGLGACGLGFCMASIFPTMLVFVESRMPVTGRVTSWFLVGASLGGMSLPWLIGQLFESSGPHILLSGVMLDLILALVVLRIVMRRSTPDAIA